MWRKLSANQAADSTSPTFSTISCTSLLFLHSSSPLLFSSFLRFYCLLFLPQFCPLFSSAPPHIPSYPPPFILLIFLFISYFHLLLSSFFLPLSLPSTFSLTSYNLSSPHPRFASPPPILPPSSPPTPLFSTFLENLLLLLSQPGADLHSITSSAWGLVKGETFCGREQDVFSDCNMNLAV